MHKFSFDKSLFRTRRRHKIVGVAAVITLLAASVMIWQFWLKPHPVIPPDVQKQLNFNMLLPATNTTAKLDKSSIKYDKESGVLSFLVNYQNSVITVTEQAYPDVLIYDRLVGTLKQYDEVQTKSGKLALTRPDAAGGSQVGVLNVNNQTLVFIKPTIDLKNGEWQQLINTFETSK